MEYVQIGFMLFLLALLTYATNKNAKEYEKSKKKKDQKYDINKSQQLQEVQTKKTMLIKVSSYFGRGKMEYLQAAIATTIVALVLWNAIRNAKIAEKDNQIEED